jgi:hypothetical protein
MYVPLLILCAALQKSTAEPLPGVLLNGNVPLNRPLLR